MGDQSGDLKTKDVSRRETHSTHTHVLEYTESEMQALQQELRRAPSTHILQFALRLMKQDQYEKSIQILHAFKDRFDINEYVTDTHGTKVKFLYMYTLQYLVWFCKFARSFLTCW